MRLVLIFFVLVACSGSHCLGGLIVLDPFINRTLDNDGRLLHFDTSGNLTSSLDLNVQVQLEGGVFNSGNGVSRAQNKIFVSDALGNVGLVNILTGEVTPQIPPIDLSIGTLAGSLGSNETDLIMGRRFQGFQLGLFDTSGSHVTEIDAEVISGFAILLGVDIAGNSIFTARTQNDLDRVIVAEYDFDGNVLSSFDVGLLVPSLNGRTVDGLAVDPTTREIFLLADLDNTPTSNSIFRFSDGGALLGQFEIETGGIAQDIDFVSTDPFSVTPVPEPSSMILFGVGLFSILIISCLRTQPLQKSLLESQ